LVYEKDQTLLREQAVKMSPDFNGAMTFDVAETQDGKSSGRCQANTSQMNSVNN